MGADSGRSWAERRGIESIDLNTGLVLARTGIEELAREIAAGSKSWERDVLGKHVRVATDFGWVFRIEGRG